MAAFDERLPPVWTREASLTEKLTMETKSHKGTGFFPSFSFLVSFLNRHAIIRLLGIASLTSEFLLWLNTDR